jgi:hypothetical protein
MNTTKHSDTRQLLCYLGVVLFVIGIGLIPGMVVLAPNSPTSGELIIDRWATFKVRLPGNVMAMTGGALTLVTFPCVIWNGIANWLQAIRD